VDPSVEFGLRFETQETESDADDPSADPDDIEVVPDKTEAEVVSLDSFRK